MRSPPPLQSAALLALSLIAIASSADAQCLEWDSAFAAPGPQGLAGGTVWTLTPFDDGTGLALFAGGDFTTTDGQPSARIAKWDGSTWTPLGSGLDGSAYASAVFDDGTGPALFVGGDFTVAGGVPASSIAKWDGSAWTPLGAGVDGTVESLVVYDDGTGPALFVGGSFSNAGVAAPATNIAKWNGAFWAPLLTGTDGAVLALAVFDDGAGAHLYAGGTFSTAGGVPAENIARWDGAAWSAIGVASGQVQALAVHDDGSGQALFVGGLLFSAGGVPVNNVARWDGAVWSGVGTGVNLFVIALSVHDDGSGSALYASGLGGGSDQVAMWDGATWTTLGAWPHPVGSATGATALASFDAGSGSDLYSGVLWQNFPSYLPGLHLARWDSTRWFPVGAGGGIPGGVADLAVFDENKLPELFAAGPFTLAGSNPCEHVARWDGSAWQSVAGGTDGPVRALEVFESGGGRMLAAGGSFSLAGGGNANNIAMWDAGAWQALGSGVDGEVRALTFFVDDLGPALFVAGTFATAGGIPAENIARWDGSNWSALGSGVEGTIEVLGSFDDGAGPALYVGGSLTAAGGLPVANIAKWDGAAWSALGAGTNGPVLALASFDDGAGADLYVGGSFSTAGPLSADNLACWNGAAWSRPGGLNPPFYNTVTALMPFDHGSGPAIVAAQAVFPPEEMSKIFTWNGAVWSQTYEIQSGNVSSAAVLDQGGQGAADLYFGGDFLGTTVGPATVGVGQWLGCGHPGQRFCFGDGSGAACPCGNSGAAGRGCDNSAVTGGASLDSSGWASLRYDSLVLTSSGELASALSVYFQGDLRITPRLFGDGLRCTGGHLKRLYVKSATGGVVTAPESGDPSFSAFSALRGDPLSPGRSRYYQVYYRDPAPGFCPMPPGNTWNVSNAIRIDWEL